MVVVLTTCSLLSHITGAAISLEMLRYVAVSFFRRPRPTRSRYAFFLDLTYPFVGDDGFLLVYLRVVLLPLLLCCFGHAWLLTRYLAGRRAFVQFEQLEDAVDFIQENYPKLLLDFDGLVDGDADGRNPVYIHFARNRDDPGNWTCTTVNMPPALPASHLSSFPSLYSTPPPSTLKTRLTLRFRRVQKR